MTITIKTSGSFKKTIDSLKKLESGDIYRSLDSYGQAGVDALSRATPIDTSETARSWTYKVVQTKRGASIVWMNSHIDKGVSIALILQYGHGTGTGGYVQGRDYINPTMQPAFDKMVEDIMGKVRHG